MNFFSIGMACFGASVIIGNLKVILFSFCDSVLSLFFIFGSIAFYILCFWFVSSIFRSSDIYASFMPVHSDLTFYLVLLLVILCSTGFDFAYTNYQ